MSNSHDNKVAIITGAASGIGQAVCQHLARRGATVVLVDKNDASRTQNSFDSESLKITTDITTGDAWAAIAEQVMEKYGRIDILVNNAGIMPNMVIDELPDDLWRTTMAVNLDAHFFAAKHVVPIMRRQEYGRIVSISSNSVGTPTPGFTAYMASKMGVVGFVRALANDVGQDGITVNAVMPGLTITPGTSIAPEPLKVGVMMAQSIKRLSVPDDIAGPIAFLTSEEARHITGQVLVVDGGMYKIS